MSVPSTNRYTSTTLAADTTNPQAAYEFLINATAELEVILLRSGTSSVVSTSDWTVDNIGNVNGGTIYITGSYLSGDIFLARLITPDIQGSVYKYMGSFPRNKVEGMGDYLMNAIKRCLNLIDLCVKIPAGELGSTDTELTGIPGRAGKVLGFDESGIPGAIDGNGIGLAAIGSAAVKSIAAGGSASLVSIALGADQACKVTFLVDIEGRGMSFEVEYLLRKKSSTLYAERGSEGTWPDNATNPAETIDISIATGSGSFVVTLVGTNLTSTRNVHARWKIESFDNLGGISYTAL